MAFSEERWSDAERLYEAALREADRLFEAARAGDEEIACDVAPMLVVATANLAETWLKLRDRRRAGLALVALSHRLCAVVEDEACTPALREQCFVHLKAASAQLLATLPRAGWSPRAVAREVMEARATALRFMDHVSPRH